MSEYEEAIKYLQDAWDELTKQVLIPIKEYNGLHTEIARLNEIIRRLKEDAERLALLCYVWKPEHHGRFCTWCRHADISVPLHAPDCPITLHRALMKELE